jgi:histidinol dehydrogenase
MKIVDARQDLRLLIALTERRLMDDPAIGQRARQIVDRVKLEGDEALTTLTRELDCRFIDSLGLRVGLRDIENAWRRSSPEFRKALQVARRNITRFHRKQLSRSWTMTGNGVKLSQRFRPLNRVGIYVPGGKAAYPSTVLMNALPARIAGVRDVVMVTPANAEGKIVPEVLAAAHACGITEICRVGGAQAIAALAYGTESIPRVEKITGPGNAYVAAAKRMVFGTVGIDMIAGPTEVVVVADGTADPAFIAADLIAQAEHDELAAPIVLTTSLSLAPKIAAEVERQLSVAPRETIARKACDRQGVIAIVKNLRAAADAVNDIAPEHLEVMTAAPRKFAAMIDHAGSIFLGPWSTEALGDYVAGPNHTLPTSGSSRFSSPLGVADFLKFTNIIEVSLKGFRKLAPAAEVLAKAEGLFGHAASVSLRRGKQ